jgi:hypothetical protein
VDIVVGIATYNNAATVGTTVQALREGLLRYFPRERAVVVNADGGSKDGTQELVTGASISDVRSQLYALRTLHCISTVYPGGPAQQAALRTILAASDLLRATACVIISPDSSGIEPDWVERLLRPVYREHYDFVTPVYRRHKFDGLLLRNLVYPMSRAVYGKRIREPYAVDFCFSGRFSGQIAERELENHELGWQGTELGMTISAVANGFRMYQTFLGAKPHVTLSPDELVPALRQTVGTLFLSLEPNAQFWSMSSGSESVPFCGADFELGEEPIRVNRERIFQMFRSGVADLEPVLKSLLSPDTLIEIQRIAQLSENEFRYTDELWAKTVYEFAVSFHRSVMNRDHIIQALAPLYRGKVFTFLIENRDASSQEVEASTESLCLTFERLKPYLVEQWSAKE